jgi:hypothetical protein
MGLKTSRPTPNQNKVKVTQARVITKVLPKTLPKVVQSQASKIYNFVTSKKESTRAKMQLLGLQLPTKQFNEIKSDAIKNEVTMQTQIRNQLSLTKSLQLIKLRSKLRNDSLLRKLEAMINKASK